MTGWMKWWYHDANSRRVFQHYRKDRTPTPDDPRTKAYGYRYLVAVPGQTVVGEWVDRKPPGADSLIFRLPLVLDNRDELLLLAEGERCACAALNRGVLASTHHGGAGRFSEAMAESLARHRGRIDLVADNDPAGALDVCRRLDLLRAVGIPAKRLRVLEVTPTHKGADLRDHLEAGYPLSDLRSADVDRLRGVAVTTTGATSEGSWGVSPGEVADLKRWRPEVVPRRPRNGRTPAGNAGVLR